MCKLPQSIAEHVIHVQGHKVKFQTAITRPWIARLSSNLAQSLTTAQVARYKVQMFNVKGQRSRSQRNVTYKQEKHSKMATDRLSEFKLATGDVLKRIGIARRRAASSCNAFAIATFSSIK